jgi:hypothetical protein
MHTGDTHGYRRIIASRHSQRGEIEKNVPASFMIVYTHMQIYKPQSICSHALHNIMLFNEVCIYDRGTILV